MSKQEEYMRAAIHQAELAEQAGEVPIGAVIVRNDEIITETHNMKQSENMVLCHAEMIAIRNAEIKLDRMYLEDCDLYVTLEPCMMCAGAISLARIRRLYYGTESNKTGCIHSAVQLKGIPFIGTYPKEIYAGLLHNDCSQLLKDFFKSRRNK